MSLGKGLGVGFRRVVGAVFLCKIREKGNGGGKGGGVGGRDRQMNRQVNAQAPSKLRFSKLPFP